MHARAQISHEIRRLRAEKNRNQLNEIQSAGKPARWPASRWRLLLLLSAFAIRRLGMLVGVLRMLLGLGRVLLARGMIVPAMRLGRGTMRLCCGFVKLRRLVVCVFHFVFSCWPQIPAPYKQLQ
jgi:hypothetical protein